MHNSYAVPLGPGNSRDMQSLGVYVDPALRGHFLSHIPGKGPCPPVDHNRRTTYCFGGNQKPCIYIHLGKTELKPA